MVETDYSEPTHELYSWRDSHEFITAEQTKTIFEAEGHIQAYTGYPDVQADIAKTVLSQLIEGDLEREELTNVVELRPAEHATVHVVSRYDPITHKLIL